MTISFPMQDVAGTFTLLTGRSAVVAIEVGGAATLIGVPLFIYSNVLPGSKIQRTVDDRITERLELGGRFREAVEG